MMRMLSQERVRRMVATYAAILFLAGALGAAQTNSSSSERVFPQSKAAIEQALKAMQANLAGHLPVLDGFAQAGDHPSGNHPPGDHPLDRYERGYYQASVEVNPNPSGGSVVRLNVKITAWYSDAGGGHGGYQLLPSNGRLESDLLDQLADQLAHGQSPTANNGAAAAGQAPAKSDRSVSSRTVSPPPSGNAHEQSGISAPSPQFPQSNQTFPSSVQQGLAAQGGVASMKDSKPLAETATDSALREEAANLEEVLKNQAHPKNLVAVKKSGTAVVGSASLSAKPLFMASAHDEFEMLDFNADWVHVRISGLSRGWIWRNSLEMPDGIRDTAATSAAALSPAADLFHVQREETAPFPGDWEPLRGKNVKIVSVQKVDENAKDAGPQDRLEYAKFLLEKNSAEIFDKSRNLAGMVLVFDSADGGMIAATAATLQQWKSGKLSDSALWHQCFFDPPETFEPAGSAASQ